MNQKSIRSIIARRTKKFRIEKELTQKELAKAAGVHYSYLPKIESSKKLPSLKTICTLADSLDVKVHELLIPEETHGKLGQKKEQLIQIIKESSEKELGIYLVIIEALEKSQS